MQTHRSARTSHHWSVACAHIIHSEHSMCRMCSCLICCWLCFSTASSSGSHLLLVQGVVVVLLLLVIVAGTRLSVTAAIEFGDSCTVPAMLNHHSSTTGNHDITYTISCIVLYVAIIVSKRFYNILQHRFYKLALPFDSQGLLAPRPPPPFITPFIPNTYQATPEPAF